MSSWNEECGFKGALFQTARKLLKNIHKKVIDSLDDQQPHTTVEHAKWLDELNGHIPNKKSAFIELWPNIYQEIIDLQYNNDTV